MRIAKMLVALILAGAGGVTAQDLPENLKAPANETMSVRMKASGVQIYACSARKEDPSKYEWTLKAPEAELYEWGTPKLVGKHYAGPTWESDDGSKVVGAVKARDDGPDATAIPWLLLSAKSNAGNGVFAKTTSIQRIDTKGGKAPAEGCDAAQAGKEVRVPYTATYVFFAAK